jgi:hypothetical protein
MADDTVDTSSVDTAAAAPGPSTDSTAAPPDSSTTIDPNTPGAGAALTSTNGTGNTLPDSAYVQAGMAGQPMPGSGAGGALAGAAADQAGNPVNQPYNPVMAQGQGADQAGGLARQQAAFKSMQVAQQKKQARQAAINKMIAMGQQQDPQNPSFAMQWGPGTGSQQGLQGNPFGSKGTM